MTKYQEIIDSLKKHNPAQAEYIDEEINIFELIQTAMRCGVMLDPFLFCPNAFRIAPPLIINEEQVNELLEKLSEGLALTAKELLK